MRNLQNLQHLVLRSSASAGPTTCAWDASSNSIICVSGPSEDDSLVTLRRWSYSIDSKDTEKECKVIAAWDAPCPSPDLTCDRTLDVHYFHDSLSVCIILAGGDIVVVREEPIPGQDKIEIVGSVDVGIAAAAWAPDEELLVILTNSETFLYMSRDFESITDLALSSEDLKTSKHVSVGWGKAETQFRGKGAKALRDPTMPEKVDEGLFSVHDNKESTISWRGDGAYVAVNSSQASNRRVIRVYSRDGELDGVSEPVDYMERGLSWRPSGNLIASVQRFEDRIEVIFFERNGLRHGQFSLRLSKEDMETWASSIDLQWNVDSTVLAVSFLDRIQLWTMSNYHYYLKQELQCQSESLSSRPPAVSWHPEYPLLLSVSHKGFVQRLEYGWRVAAGSKAPPYDYGLVSVIDGKDLKITPMRLSNVPPPMALTGLSVSDNIVDVAYYDTFSDKSSILFAVLNQRNLLIFAWSVKEKPANSPSLKYSISLTSDKIHHDGEEMRKLPRQVTFLGPRNLLVLTSNDTGSWISYYKISENTLHVLSSIRAEPTRELLKVEGNEPYTSCIWRNDGRIEVSKFGDLPTKQNHQGPDIVSPSLMKELPTNIESVLILNYATQGDAENPEAIVFGLRRNGSLFAHKRCLSKDCTSFVATPSHLIYTTSQHLLKFVHLADVEELEIPPDTPEVDERCRSIERGAKLITVIPSISALILEMPRGNLETIYPRALVLPAIRKSISEGKYKKAFLACRNHRVDMNILHDHAPDQFLQSVDQFLNQVQKVESVDLFLSHLREEDVSLTMYKETLPQGLATRDSGNSLAGKGEQKASKVNRICNAFLQELASRTSTNLQNLITAHVCKNPPDLEAGLQEVAKLQKKSHEDAERAVEHICFLTDANRLFDTALGLYDLDLTLLVAQQSQRDPREYLPFLQNLKQQESLRMRVAIDNHLSRWPKVLDHLHALNDFPAFEAHTQKHSLYPQALHLYRYSSTHLASLTRLYAAYLSSKSQHKDAALAYESLSDYQNAAESYRLAHLWREALTCASLIPLGESAITTFTTQLADALTELKDYHAAATIQADYLSNIEAATRLLCKGSFFVDATRLITLHKQQHLLASVLDPGLAEAQASTTELLAEMKSQLSAQVPRIRELRLKKAAEPLSFYDPSGVAAAADGIDAPDNVSLVPTDASTAGGGTLFTRYTARSLGGTVATGASRRTSKKARLEERKRARGKKGSVYEEEYLVNSVGRLVERANGLGEEVGRLVMGLVRRGMRERAIAVERSMSEVVQACRDAVEEVFGDESEGKDAVERKGAEAGKYGLGMGGGGGERPPGGDGVLWDALAQSRVKREKPVVKGFERVAVLGG